MNQVKAYGTFIQRKGYLYKVSSYLQWGNSDQILGACVMCNSGHSTSKCFSENDNKKLNDQKSVHVEMDIDKDLYQIISIVAEINDNNIVEGRILLLDLFTLQDPSDNAIECIVSDEKLQKDVYLYHNFRCLRTHANDLPWILISWGSGRNEIEKEQKKCWLEFIEESNIPYLGIKKDETLDFCDLPSKDKDDPTKYVKKIVDQYCRIFGTFFYIQFKYQKGEGFIQIFKDGKVRVEVPGDLWLENKIKKLSSLYNFKRGGYKISNIAKFNCEFYVLSANDQDVYIEGASSIFRAYNYEEITIVLYKKGNSRIEVNRTALNDITKNFKSSIDNEKDVIKYPVILNGQKLDYNPRIDFSSDDLIISNGHVIFAQKLDDFEGLLSFFSDDPSIPIAWIHGSDNPIYIDIYEKEDSKVCIINATVDLDTELFI